MLIKTNDEAERRHREAILRSFGVRGNGTPEQREAAEIIAARSKEVVKGGRKIYG